MGNSSTHVANATGKPLRVYYEVESMKLEDIVLNVSGSSGGTLGPAPTATANVSTTTNMVFKPDSRIRYIRLPVDETCKFSGEGKLYASVFVEDKQKRASCNKIICKNYKIPRNRSFIVTANHNIKFTKKKSEDRWIDEDGINHKPQTASKIVATVGCCFK
ncbi:UNVERIFIED_CONTAM: hypothetical protein FKN15_054067 [Acipenser sinensis]